MTRCLLGWCQHLSISKTKWWEKTLVTRVTWRLNYRDYILGLNCFSETLILAKHNLYQYPYPGIQNKAHWMQVESCSIVAQTSSIVLLVLSPRIATWTRYNKVFCWIWAVLDIRFIKNSRVHKSTANALLLGYPTKTLLQQICQIALLVDASFRRELTNLVNLNILE